MDSVQHKMHPQFWRVVLVACTKALRTTGRYALMEIHQRIPLWHFRRRRRDRSGSACRPEDSPACIAFRKQMEEAKAAEIQPHLSEPQRCGKLGRSGDRAKRRRAVAVMLYRRGPLTTAQIVESLGITRATWHKTHCSGIKENPLFRIQGAKRGGVWVLTEAGQQLAREQLQGVSDAG